MGEGSVLQLTDPIASGQTDDQARQIIADQAARFREALAADGRATKLTQLFDYLVERSADPRAPKEIEIAIAVFGKSAAVDTSQDSTVRAHVYRLRQRLESFNAGVSGARLHIPKGEYRLVLLEDSEGDAGADATDASPVSISTTGEANARRVWTFAAIGAVVSLAAWAMLWAGPGWPGGGARSPVPSLGQSALWRPIAQHPQQPVVAVSDFYMVAEDGPDKQIARLVMHPEIQSPLDLDRYLGQRPLLRETQHDREVYRVPSSIAVAAASTLSLVGAARNDHAVGEIIPVSKLSQNIVDTRNVIYFAPFSQLGKLRSPILAMSSFAPGADFDEIRDRATGAQYRAIGQPGQLPRPASAASTVGYDYGYLTSFRSRAGNQTVVISGIEDAALAQMVHILADRQQLDALARRVSGTAAFEALYQFRTAGGLVFDTRLIAARPLAEPVSAPQATPPS